MHLLYQSIIYNNHTKWNCFFFQISGMSKNKSLISLISFNSGYILVANEYNVQQDIYLLFTHLKYFGFSLSLLKHNQWSVKFKDVITHYISVATETDEFQWHFLQIWLRIWKLHYLVRKMQLTHLNTIGLSLMHHSWHEPPFV